MSAGWRVRRSRRLADNFEGVRTTAATSWPAFTASSATCRPSAPAAPKTITLDMVRQSPTRWRIDRGRSCAQLGQQLQLLFLQLQQVDPLVFAELVELRVEPDDFEFRLSVHLVVVLRIHPI